MPRLAVLSLLATLMGFAHTVSAVELANGLTLEGDITLESRHSALDNAQGIRLRPHLRWTSPNGVIGLDLGTDLFRDNTGLNALDLTYGSVSLHTPGGALHLGRPKTAIETLVAFPDFSQSTNENLFADLTTRSLFRAADMDTPGTDRGLTWTQSFGNLDIALSRHRWAPTGFADAMQDAQIAMRLHQGSLTVMAGAELAWTSLPLFGTTKARAFHLGATQESGAWRFGALWNHFSDNAMIARDVLRLHVDYDLTPDLNLGLQYQRLEGLLTLESVALNARYDMPGKPLFLEATALKDDLAGKVVAVGVGVKF